MALCNPPEFGRVWRACTYTCLTIRVFEYCGYSYDDCMRKMLDKHAPLKTIQVVEKPMNDWINDDILALKIKRRRNESLWRRTRLTIHYDL